VFDVTSDCLVLQQLGFFGDMARQNSFQVWQDTVNQGKMMNSKALMILLGGGPWISCLITTK